MAKKIETVEARALKIAAHCLVQAGCCRYDDISKCRRTRVPTADVCEICIRQFLLDKARKELT